MKKAILVIVMISVILAFPPAHANAGTFTVGAKSWYAYWDSAVLDWFEKDIGAGFIATGVTLSSSVDKGKGYLAGPVFGYQTDDKTWSFSLAAMAFSDFSQDWHGTAGTMNLTTNIDTTRRDFDFAATYSLARHQDAWSFLQYCRVFLGYKFQTVNYDLTLHYDTAMGSRTYNYKLDAKVHMPTVGAGIAYPIRENIVLGLQAGVGLALIDLNMTDPDGVEFAIDPKYSLSFNTEANLNFVPLKNLIVQAGFRYQEWYLKARSPQRWEKTESKDVTYGPTLTVVYAF